MVGRANNRDEVGKQDSGALGHPVFVAGWVNDRDEVDK